MRTDGGVVAAGAVAALPVALILGALTAPDALLTAAGVHGSAAGMHDAKAPAGRGAPVDRTPALPSGFPWQLRADRLVLHESAFHGVVTVRTATGPKRVLKFTARSLDIGDLDVTAGHGPVVTRLRARPGTTSTVRTAGKGVVTLYTLRLSGTVVGLGGAPLPEDRRVTVTPDALPQWLSQPAVPVRTLALADVTATQVAQFGGDLSVTGAVLSAAPG
ncbi:hypothetical protein ACWGI8_22675 [Streptomyces sp. NPDC054841]